MKQIFSILALVASLALFSCDTGGSNSLFDQDSGDDSCDQELIDHITLASMLCSSWSTLGYASYDACKADKNEQMLDLFLLCKIKENDSDEEK
jgi:hypothetical protein